MLRYCLSFPCMFMAVVLCAQTVRIPAYTGYAVPVEKEASDMFSVQKGLHWTDTRQEISYSFYVRKTGVLQLTLLAKNSVAGSQLKLLFNGQEKLLQVPAGKTFTKIPAGRYTISDTGFYTLQLKAVKNPVQP